LIAKKDIIISAQVFLSVAGGTMKKIAAGIGIVVIVLVFLFFIGPRTKIDQQIKPINLPADLDQYLAESEAQFSDIVPGTEKTIVWANAEKTKTPLSIVYLHGYSATRQETVPLSDELAAQLGANLFYTRLTGHGRGSAAMAEPTVNDWLNDTMEALEIGKRLGDKVIVIGTSTGGTLAAWLAEQPNTDEVLAYVLISPNFGPRDPNSEILTLPWGKQLVTMIVGPEYSWEPTNPEHAKYWTHSYPSPALATMMGLVKFVRESDLESIEKPVLVIYSPNDQVVNSEKTEQRVAQIGSDIKEIDPILDSGNPENHVLAGDILAPENTEAVKELILNFISQLQ
jgi:esterase/lipase